MAVGFTPMSAAQLSPWRVRSSLDGLLLIRASDAPAAEPLKVSWAGGAHFV